MTYLPRIVRQLAVRSKARELRMGDPVTVFPDKVVLDESAAVAVADVHANLGRRNVKHPERFLIVPRAVGDPDERRRLVTFAREFRLPVSLSPASAGELSIVATERGEVGSDDLVLGTSAEAAALGGLGAAVLAGDPAAVSNLMIGRPLEVVMPPVRTVGISGRLPRGVGAFDLALAIVEAAAEGGGGVLELHGEAVAALDVPGRLELCGALAGAGLVAGVPPDHRTAIWLQARRAGAKDPPSEPEAPVTPDLELDAARVPCRAVQTPWPGRWLTLGRPEAEAVKTVVVALGGRVESLRVAADVLREHHVHPDVHLFVVPGSHRVLLHATEEGLLADLLRSGATLLPPGGRPPEPWGRAARVVTAGGRDGDVVASSAVAAATAVLGHLAHPDAVGGLRRRGSRIG